MKKTPQRIAQDEQRSKTLTNLWQNPEYRQKMFKAQKRAGLRTYPI